MLNLYTETRACFDMLPEVIEYLIQAALNLTFRVKNISRNQVNKKIIGFI